MARPKKSPADKKGKTINVPVTKAQEAAILAICKQQGDIPKAEWARSVILREMARIQAEGNIPEWPPGQPVKKGRRRDRISDREN